MPRNTLAIDGDFLDAPTPQDASLRFFNAARAVGATYIQTRLYRRPTRPLTSRTHYDAGGFIVRVAPEGWEGSDAFNYICFECNPLLAPIRENRTTYRFSDFAPRDRREFGAYWDALSQARIGQALCATSYGPHQAITSLHLGFERWDLPDQEARAIQMAGLMLTERLMDFALPPVENAPALTHRERDCLALVADGKSDWTISKLLHVSEATVRFHLNNARKKPTTPGKSSARSTGPRPWREWRAGECFEAGVRPPYSPAVIEQIAVFPFVARPGRGGVLSVRVGSS